MFPSSQRGDAARGRSTYQGDNRSQRGKSYPTNPGRVNGHSARVPEIDYGAAEWDVPGLWAAGPEWPDHARVALGPDPLDGEQEGGSS
jgi:hypothetical protein